MADASLDTPKTKILIVDDEMRMRRVITDYLRIKGYETAEAGDGMEALEKFEVFAPDLIPVSYTHLEGLTDRVRPV